MDSYKPFIGPPNLPALEKEYSCFEVEQFRLLFLVFSACTDINSFIFLIFFKNKRFKKQIKLTFKKWKFLKIIR
jgi:hypothetical protein